MRSKVRPSARAIERPREVLPTPGRPDEGEDRAARVRLERAHRQELEDPVLDLLDVVVVGVQDLARVGEIEVVLRRGVPRQRGDPLQIGAHDAVLGHRRLQALEAAELTIDLLGDLVGELERLQLGAQLVGLRLGLVALPQLFLDGLELLAQEEVALPLVHLGLDLGLDLGADLGDLELASEDLRQPPQPLGDVELLEQLLLVRRRQAQGAGDEVGEHHRVLDVGHHHRQLLRQVRDLADDGGELALDVAHQRGQLRALGDDVGGALHLGDEVGLSLDPLRDAHALRALDEHPQGVIGQADHPGDGAEHPDVIELLGGGRLDLGVAAGEQDDRAVAAQGVVDELDAARLADVERHDQFGEGDRIAQRQHADAVRQAARADRHLLVVLVGNRDLDQRRRGAHDESPLSIGTIRDGVERCSSGTSMRSIPSRYCAVACSAWTSAPSWIARRNAPRSISTCW